MRSIPSLLAFLQATTFVHAVVNFKDDSCKTWAVGDVRSKIEEEMNFAMTAAEHAAKDLQRDYYYERFFPESLRAQPDFAAKVSGRFEKIRSMASGIDSGYKVEVTCDNSTPMCQLGHWAHMNARSKIMNFCEPMFKNEKVKTSRERVADCNMDLRGAQRTPSMVLIHELSHTKYAMGRQQTGDFSYGMSHCLLLAQGKFNRGCHGKDYPKVPKIFCPDPADPTKEGPCRAEYAEINADTYSFIAAGVFFSTICSKEIPLPDDVPKKRGLPSTLLTVAHPPLETQLPAVRSLKRADDNCGGVGDAIFWDEPVIPDESAENGGLQGYVHFGDSYGAGMGTGTTSGDSCRVGSNNYGDLLYKSFNDDKIPYERKVCSGDTINGLAKQVEGWKDPSKANVGTVSIGGNDIGFSDLVWYCIITPYTGRTSSSNRALCEEAKKRAYGIMVEDGLQVMLAAAYELILGKSGRDDFHLYVTGYTPFFNVDTSDCDKSSFHYWWGGYNPASDPRIVHLTKELRVEMNDLVVKLNAVIEAAVQEANKETGSNRIHYVDVGSRYNNHRFCEEGTHEPEPDRADTWFFLSGWPDVNPTGAMQSETVDQAEVRALIGQGSIPLPNPDCDIADIKDIDPYERAICRIAQSVKEDPEGPEAKFLATANQHIKEGKVDSQEIGWFTPTRQIKTFHPRSAGMEAYHQAVRQSIGEHQNF